MFICVSGSNLVIKAIRMMIEQGCDEVRIFMSKLTPNLILMSN